ncbi:MAG: NAD(P)/FAD-dependent oxidoreductase [Acidimicrobiaceae bacterium]|nr:NAD(P)/FAD-dependent oxidoreductase [Acidimicrobiaceae bacterium]
MQRHVDAVVVGAGFSGIYMTHKLRQIGLSVVCIEKGEGVGGTWYWNRYPGARVDTHSVEYSFSFSEEIQQEFDWTDVMPTQPDVERYLNFVTDRLDLRPCMLLGTAVTRLSFDEDTGRWTVETDSGQRCDAQFVVAATGALSVPIEPDIAGLDTFGGETLYTNRFPAEGYDFHHHRVGVIGTGSSGIQCIPVIAEQADQLYVFQRSAAYTRPSIARPFEPGELEAIKEQYPAIRARERAAFGGLIWLNAIERDGPPPERKILDTPLEERMEVLDELAWEAPLAWADVLTDLEANDAARDLYAELVRRVVEDPETAASLVPHYPMGCKRLVLDVGYYEAFNRPNVRLVDLRKGGIERITPSGVKTAQGDFEIDVLVCATGFDAITGALKRIEIKGREGRTLNETWGELGPLAYLGLQIPGYPNLFTVNGPGSPSVLTNMVVAIEQHVEWIAECIAQVRERNLHTIEATLEASEEWALHVGSLAEGSVRTAESCQSWYLGANVPGKQRLFLPYVGGLPRYRERCREVADEGYTGFQFS